MSDFDEVLERLVADPEFQAALRRDPDAALQSISLRPRSASFLTRSSTTRNSTTVPGAARVEMRLGKSGCSAWWARSCPR